MQPQSKRRPAAGGGWLGYIWASSASSENSSVGRAVDCRMNMDINWSLVQFRLLGSLCQSFFCLFLSSCYFLFVVAQ